MDELTAKHHRDTEMMTKQARLGLSLGMVGCSCHLAFVNCRCRTAYLGTQLKYALPADRLMQS